MTMLTLPVTLTPSPLVLKSSYALIFAYLATKLYSAYDASCRDKTLPPGPPTSPFLGNLLQFPRTRLHLKLTEWAREYGDIISVQVLHMTIVVINSPTMVKELIDKRGAATCNRPASIIADMVIPNNLNIGSGQYAGETWRVMRKAAVHMLRPESVDSFKPYQRAEAAQLLWEMTHQPENFYEDINRYITSFFMGMIYGHREPQSTSKIVKDFAKMERDFLNCMDVGKAPPVDLFPILKVVPAYFAKWKRDAHDLKNRQEEIFGYLLNIVKRRMSRGDNNNTFMEEVIKNQRDWDLTDEMVLHLGGTLLEGSDTSSAILQGIVLVLAAHPEVQAKAQQELDSVVGSDRIPDWSDLESLTWVKAIVEEFMRFRPVGPLALPHACAEDVPFENYVIPKGTTIFTNLWALFHNPEYYEEPEKYNPERFIKHPHGVRLDIVDDPARRENLVFGGGRRVCPGIYTGKAGLEINVANFLWAFTFKPPLTASGKEAEMDLNAFSESFILTPDKFDVRIIPRSQEKVTVIDNHLRDQLSILSAYEMDLEPEDKEYMKKLRASLGNW